MNKSILNYDSEIDSIFFHIELCKITMSLTSIKVRRRNVIVLFLTNSTNYYTLICIHNSIICNVPTNTQYVEITPSSCTFLTLPLARTAQTESGHLPHR